MNHTHVQVGNKKNESSFFCSCLSLFTCTNISLRLEYLPTELAAVSLAAGQMAIIYLEFSIWFSFRYIFAHNYE